MAEPDPRLTPARPDLAAERLRGRVVAPRYVAPRRKVTATPVAPMVGAPDGDAPVVSQLLLGEAFDVYDSADGWCWGQAVRDGYVGYVPAACLDALGPAPTHRVTAPQAPVFAAPDIKSRPVGAAPLGAPLAAAADAPGFLALDRGGYLCAQHAAALDAPWPDWVRVARMFLHAPYLWGGRTVGGLDCSGLIQIARQAAGRDCPRDSDMQAAEPGRDVAPGGERRGDLIFWAGHVGVMLGPRRLLHANAHHMAVVAEPLAVAEARIAATYGPVTARRRWR